MYTRNRQNQNYGSARNSNSQMSGSGPPSTYNTKGSYQSSQSASHQQSNYKQGSAQQNLPSVKSQQQPQQQQQQSQQQQQPQQQSMQMTSASAPTRPLPQVKQQVTSQQQLQQQGQQQQPPPQQQQQQQQQQSPQHQQGQQQSVQQQQSSPQAPLPQRLKPILKQSVLQPTVCLTATPQSKTSQPNVPPPLSAASTSSNVKTESVDKGDMSENMNIDLQEQPRWRRKTPGFKVNKKLKRLRMNQRLRKTLQPKNAIMVLNEMKAGCQFTFPETPGHVSNSLYLVHAELDGKTYVGQGLSKPLARQAAAENALKALLLEKMTAASMKARIDAESDGQANSSSDTMKDESNEDVSMDNNSAEDEIPWSSLASFALYKLFLEWHNQGTSVPVTRPGLPAAKGVKKESAGGSPRAPTQKELPPNPTNIHPVMLLNQMRPGLTYVEVNRLGNPPNTTFTLSVEVNGVSYSGTAKNKKDAKKAAAKAALLSLYSLTYPDEIAKEPMQID
ncbi:double-stranded RNA-specific editase 1 isoform X2 [Harpegnathos saltator]|uniref:double-stranded RNA-specific editase 1 isoform X2 n=1 Tax=Harpegnathos saltator TaxID=610380 RepID=UPI00058F5B51|nr:double-stranded RNA-specific editase 1 isoform X2 [Harpegnathos saltator]